MSEIAAVIVAGVGEVISAAYKFPVTRADVANVLLESIVRANPTRYDLADGLNPILPVMDEVPVFVTVVFPRMTKLAAVPRSTGPNPGVPAPKAHPAMAKTARIAAIDGNRYFFIRATPFFLDNRAASALRRFHFLSAIARNHFISALLFFDF
jgi:hypothetical protein